MCIYRVARGARDVRDDKAVLSDYLVDYRGLARVRLTDDGNLDAIVLFLLACALGELFKNSVKKIARAASVD